MSISQRNANQIANIICNNEETRGFDLSTGANWIYPLNYPIREYQYNIVETALFHNTLVSLPTGLGKTFIAAVVMYNFYRWYPNGKIIFMAPTKPLVRQQIEACYNIVGIPKENTVELTGTILQSTRATLWRDKRVFFITPHVLQNDLDNMPEIGDGIKCLVLDEAHKAKGTYAYCEVMRKVYARTRYFRVLALSATPGGSVREILEISKSLFISNIEVKTDESSDVAPYVYKRSLTIVNIPLDKKLYQVKEDYLKIIEYYARVLIENRVFTGNYSQLTKGRIFMTLKDLQSRKARNVNIPNYNEIMKSLNICLTLYHGLELLIRHGLRGFLLYYEEHIQKPQLRANQPLHNIINDLTEYLGPLPDWHPLPDGTLPKLTKKTRFGHPKFKKLGDVLSAHFLENDDDASRVIVFFEYKDSVIEAHALLLEYQPLVRARVFMGQSSITQKQQKSTLNLFRIGECNTLLSTSIGEEGLDVGEVDLIVCFDISSKSPIRLVQRMGRTGRKREGKIVVLVTDGKEEELLRECIAQKKCINESILNCSELHTQLYQDNPRMVPENLEPECIKIHITVQKQVVPARKVEKTTKKVNKINPIKALLESMPLAQGSSQSTVFEDKIDRLPEPVLLCLTSSAEFVKKDNSDCVDFSKYLEKQRSVQSTFLVDQSPTSALLMSILQCADSKRFNIPQTQIERSKTTKTGAGLYQSDIRSMFLKQKQPISQIEVDLNLNKKVTEMLLEHKQYEYSSKLQTEIRDFLTIAYSNMFVCAMCNKCKNICSLFKTCSGDESNFSAQAWTQPNDNIFECLNKDTLNKYLRQTNTDIDEVADKFTQDDFISDELLNEFELMCESKTSPTVESKNIIKSPVQNNLADFFKDDVFGDECKFNEKLLDTGQHTNKASIDTIKEVDDDDDFFDPVLLSQLMGVHDIKEKPVSNVNLSEKEKSDEMKEMFADDEFIASDIFNQCTDDMHQENAHISNDECQNTSRNTSGNTQTSRCRLKSNRKLNVSRNSVPDDDFFAVDLLSHLSNNNFASTSRSPNLEKTVLHHSLKNNSDLDKTLTSNVNKLDNKSPPSLNDKDVNNEQNVMDTDDFINYSAILEEMNRVSDPEENSNSNPLPGSPNRTLNDSHSDFDEPNALNQAFVDENAHTPESKNTMNTDSSKVSQQIQRDGGVSPDLFDSNPSSPENSKDCLDNSHDRTILFSPSLKHTSPCNNFIREKTSPDKSPTLWNLSKMYTQTSRDLNTSSRRKLLLNSSLSGMSSLSFNDSLLNRSLDIPHDTSFDVGEVLNPVNSVKKLKRKNLKPTLIDMEAEISDAQSSDENEDDLNEYDASFVNDASQDVGNNTNLHAFYLKTTRSPVKKPNGFKIPQLPKTIDMNIYSQFVSTENESYMEDSFCVDVLTQNITTATDYDPLEEAEKILKRKRRKKSTLTCDTRKRRRILVQSDDSD